MANNVLKICVNWVESNMSDNGDKSNPFIACVRGVGMHAKRAVKRGRLHQRPDQVPRLCLSLPACQGWRTLKTALPTGAPWRLARATITTAPTTVTVDQSTARAIINWAGF